MPRGPQQSFSLNVKCISPFPPPADSHMTQLAVCSHFNLLSMHPSNIIHSLSIYRAWAAQKDFYQGEAQAALSRGD